MGNTLKNYSKEGQKLPMFGVGPYLIYGIIFLKAAVLVGLTSVHFGSEEGMALQPAEISTANRKQLTQGAILRTEATQPGVVS